MRKKLLALVLTFSPLPSHADTAPFTLSQICQAGVATFYGRNIDIMKSHVLSDDEIRITYTRPEDGKLLSFKCRKHPKSNYRLNFYDESLNGARWYGADMADQQTFYTVKDNILIMRRAGNGVQLVEDFYKQSDFSPSE